jgi:uncharacterized integral membrane protein
MRYLIWPLRMLLFLALLGFAAKNDQPVALRYLFGMEWQAPLVVLLLAFFILGAALGMIAVLGKLLRQRQEIAALRREVQQHNRPADLGFPR